MSKLPTWIWYVVGALIFLAVYSYMHSMRYQTTNPIGTVVTLPNTQDLANYNGSADILGQLLTLTKPNGHLATSTMGNPNATGA